MGAGVGGAGNRPAERGHGTQGRCGNAHRAEVRRHEPHSLPLADSLLRHPAGSLLLDRRPLDRWRKDLDRSEEHTSELQSLAYLVCRLLLEKKKKKNKCIIYNSQLNT